MGTYGLHHDAARRVAIWPSRLSPMGVYGLYNDAARRVATVFEIWCCLIETDLRARRENPPKKIAPYGTFAAVSPLEYRGLKPILPFPEGRSDAACRVVIPPSRPPTMETYGLYHDAALLGRALAPLGTAPTKIPMRLVAARINGVPRRCLPSRCIPLIIASTVPKGSNCSLDSTIIPNFTHSPSQSTRITPPPYQPRTFALPSCHLRRFIFGFRWRNPKMKRRR